jgi:hypothetical protein
MDFPLPVAPVTKTNPFSLSAKFFTASGKPNSDSEGILRGIFRNTAAQLPR